MASVGYGYGKYGKADYGTPVYHFGAAAIAQTSSATAVGRFVITGAATPVGTSGFTATGRFVITGASTIAATSG
jgi:hypothetical protein